MGFNWFGRGSALPAPAVVAASPVVATPTATRPNPRPDLRLPEPPRPLPISAAASELPRGIRNNNPLNIEHHASNAWIGLDVPPSDGRFCRFILMIYGVRAAARLLRRHWRANHRTLQQLIAVWAPAKENNVAAYVGHVSRAMGVAPDTPLDLDDQTQLERLVMAMAEHENGQPVARTEVALGVSMALTQDAA